jgi:nucleoside 2-deoxyribosyltransferase
MCRTSDAPEALAVASFVASLYASTWSHEDFQDSVNTLLTMVDDAAGMRGTRIRWEDRKAHTIYIAAPDFPDVDTTPIDALVASLEYHNFGARRPVKEHGLFTSDLSEQNAKQMYRDDLNLLESAQLVIAVPLVNDPGTFTELGVASALTIPTILWNPRNLPPNLFAWSSADRRCKELHEVIDAVFVALTKPSSAGWVDT